MLELKEIKELIKLVSQTPIEHFEYEKDGTKLMLKKASTAFYDLTREARDEEIE